MRPGREGRASKHTRVLHGKEILEGGGDVCSYVGVCLTEQVQVCLHMCLNLLPNCVTYDQLCVCTYTVGLLSVCTCICVYLCLSLCSPNPEGERRVLAWFSSSFPAYLAVVSPVAQWTSILLLPSPLINIPSFLQAWRTPYYHHID